MGNSIMELAGGVATICGLTPRLTGAGSRRLEGTNISHKNAEGMAYVGVRVEPTVRLGRVVEGRVGWHGLNSLSVTFDT